MAEPVEHVERFDPRRPLPVISYGLAFEDALARHLATTLQSRRPYLLVSGSLSRSTDVVERLTARLAREGDGITVVGVCRGLRAHTFYSELLPVLGAVRATGADALVVVGGGSLVDAAKVLAFALANDIDADAPDAPDRLDGLVGSDGHAGPDTTSGRVRPSVVPYLCATTTLSAGEYSAFGGATDDRTRRKRLFQDPSPAAGHRVVVLDPNLTRTAPLDVWLATGMRAVDHCVETVCAAQPRPAATADALGGLRLLVPALLRTRADPADLDARLRAQLGAANSMKGIVVHGVQLGASHGIGHQLGPRGVPHAETTCVLLPAVLKYNAPANAPQQALVLDALWDEPAVSTVLETQGHLARETADLGDCIDAIVRALGLPRSLAHYGIVRDQLDSIAAESLTDWMCLTNPVPLKNKEQIVDILQKCF